MTKLLLVRHGESEANLRDIFAGFYDIDLTERGHAQAECTAAFIAEKYTVDAIYSSDLRRACQTAKHIADMVSLPIQPDKGMREVSAGEWEGVPFGSIGDTHPEAFRVWRNDLGNARCPGGESTAELAARVYDTVCRIAIENEGKTVVIATHATPIRVLQSRFLGRPLTDVQHIGWVSNASVTEVEYDDGEFTIVQVGQDAHLADMRTFLSEDV